MSQALVIRMGAYGDLLVALPLIEELKRRYDYLHLETGDRGKELLRCHPAVRKISTFDPMAYSDGKDDTPFAMTQLRWKTLLDTGGWDFAVNLWRTLEVECIAEEWQEEFFWPRERRQAHFGVRPFVEAPFVRAKVLPPDEFRMGTIFFPEEVRLWMPAWKAKHRDTFNVVIVVAGSTCQKLPFGLKELAQRISNEYPSARFFLLGTKSSGWMPEKIDMTELQFDFDKKNVCKLVGQTPYMQALAMVKMADYVIGPVSSLLHAAGTFGTPKSMICTDCSVYQACKYHANDFSVQGIAPCCPCHRAIYNTKYCLTEKTPLGVLPLCNMDYDKERIMEGVAFAYGIKKIRAGMERFGQPHYSSLPDFSKGKTSIAPPYGLTGLASVEYLLRKRRNLNIVEIGTSWLDGDIFGNGYSTPFFANMAKAGGHDFYSVDIDPRGIDMSGRILTDYGLHHDGVHLVVQDGLKFLEEWPSDKKIDLLYLDGWGYEADDLKLEKITYSETMHMEAAKAALPHMADGSFILIDDTIDQRNLGGKGRQAIPYLASQGWELVEAGWQFLLRKPA